jgi:hypothetical protein
VLDEATRQRFTHLSKGIFGKSGKIGMERLASALKNVNVKITENEIEYIKGVLELFDDAIVDQTEFCLVAAIAERMTMLE